jgi:hypothetical protein
MENETTVTDCPGDVFILGAGFSKAVSSSMPVLAELSTMVREKIQRADQKANLGFSENIELWLTYLSESHPWLSESANLRNRALFLEASQAVRDCLEECSNRSQAELAPSWFDELLAHWHNSKATVLTLNYDTLVEKRALEVYHQRSESLVGDPATWPYFYAAPVTPITLLNGVADASVRWPPSVPSFTLLKLHGSLNWFYSGRTDYRGEEIYCSPVYPEGTQLSWGSWKRRAAAAQRHRVPLIMPPLANKNPLFQHELIRAQWERAAAELRSARRIFCIGYSLPSSDLTMRFLLQSDATQDIRSVFVVNTDPGAGDHFKQVLSGQYLVETEFCGAEAVLRATDFVCGHSR